MIILIVVLLVLYVHNVCIDMAICKQHCCGKYYVLENICLYLTYRKVMLLYLTSNVDCHNIVDRGVGWKTRCIWGRHKMNLEIKILHNQVLRKNMTRCSLMYSKMNIFGYEKCSRFLFSDFVVYRLFQFIYCKFLSLFNITKCVSLTPLLLVRKHILVSQKAICRYYT